LVGASGGLWEIEPIPVDVPERVPHCRGWTGGHREDLPLRKLAA
jgi:hypothetical protein